MVCTHVVFIRVVQCVCSLWVCSTATHNGDLTYVEVLEVKRTLLHIPVVGIMIHEPNDHTTWNFIGEYIIIILIASIRYEVTLEHALAHAITCGFCVKLPSQLQTQTIHEFESLDKKSAVHYLIGILFINRGYSTNSNTSFLKDH